MSVLEPTQTQVAPIQNTPQDNLNGQSVYNNATVSMQPSTVQPQLNPVEAIPPTPVNEQLLAKVIPAGAEKLSSGVYVIFHKLNRSISTDLTIKTFNNVNLDKKGRLVADNLSTKDQMNMAKSISEYHSTLIMQGVELVGEIDDYEDEIELPENWVKKLFRTGLVNEKYYDVSDPDDIKFLFLRYYAFRNEDDWSLLSQNTLST
jgi:hypothetical protein